MSLHTIAYGPGPRQHADVIAPPAASAPLLVYFHGGGLNSGDPAENRELTAALASPGLGVVAAGYRLYPTARFPDFVVDAATCLAWALRTYPDRPVLAGGTSAGAYLAMLLRFDPHWLAAHDASPEAVAGWLFDGGQPTTHYNVLVERGLDPRRVVVDEAAPLFHVGAHVAARPTDVVLASDDLPGRREQTDVLLATLRAFGLADDVRTHVLDGYEHSGYLSDPAGLERFVGIVAALAERAGPAGRPRRGPV